MSYKELVLQNQFTNLLAEPRSGRPLQAFYENHSPVMKLWFVVMLANLLLVWCIM